MEVEMVTAMVRVLTHNSLLVHTKYPLWEAQYPGILNYFLEQ